MGWGARLAPGHSARGFRTGRAGSRHLPPRCGKSSQNPLPSWSWCAAPARRFPEVGAEGEGKEHLSLGAARPGLFDLLNDLSRWLRRSALLCLQPALGEGEAEGPSPAL